MADNKNKQQNNQEMNRNPTLNEPGSKVADYGNPTGGSSIDNPEMGDNRGAREEGGSPMSLDNDETIGNP